jgi:putative flavoprotein involved in K+ transport
MSKDEREYIQTVVIGAGQAGLSTGYHLKRLGLPFVILDGNERVGDAWRHRWDSLRLFSPARYDSLPGMKHSGSKYAFITKDQMADYLEAYVEEFDLPVRLLTRVHRLSREGHRFVLDTGAGELEADQVVVAMSNYQQPKVPAFASELDPEIRQLHSLEYRNPGQLQDGPVLIVGTGNSGAEIGIEVARTHETIMSGRRTRELPFRIDSFGARHVGTPFISRIVFHRILTMGTPIGRMMRPKVLSGGAPLIRVKAKQLAKAGVERVPRTVGIRDGRPVLEDGRVLDVANVIWCTGFHHGFSWIDLPVFDDDGEPAHEAGIVTKEPGLYFVGLDFLYAFSSEMVHGVERDAGRIAKAVAARVRAEQRMTASRPSSVEARPDVVGG